MGNCHSPRNQVRSPGQSYTYMLIKIGLWRIIPRDFRQFSIYCVTHAVDGSYPETSDSSQYTVLLTQLTDHTQRLQTVLNILCYSRSWRIIPRAFRQFSIYCVTHAVAGPRKQKHQSSENFAFIDDLYVGVLATVRVKMFNIHQSLRHRNNILVYKSQQDAHVTEII